MKYCGNKRIETILRMQAGTCLLLHVSCSVAVIWRFPLPNKSPSFEVSAFFLFVKLMTFFICGKSAGR